MGVNYYYEMVVKVEEKFEKTRNIEKKWWNEKKYLFRGERNVKYYERFLSNQKKSFPVYSHWFCINLLSFIISCVHQLIKCNFTTFYIFLCTPIGLV